MALNNQLQIAEAREQPNRNNKCLMYTIIGLVLLGFLSGFCVYIILDSEQFNDTLKTSHMDKDDSIDPCDDFYSFACGKWEKLIKRPDYVPEWSVSAALHMQNIQLVSEILEDSVKDHDIQAYKQAQEYYKECSINGSGNILLQKIHEVYPNKGLRKNCSLITFEKFWWPITNKLAVSKYKNEVEFGAVKAKILEMFQNVRESLEKTNIPNYNKMYGRTKACIGFPLRIFDQQFVQNQWKENFEILPPSQTQLGNDRVSLFKLLNSLDCLWELDPRTAYFKGGKIKPQVVLPSMYLQAQFFEQNGPTAKNYGALGYVMGHELAHAYSVEYWRSLEGQQMNKYVSCLKPQYSSFTVEGPNNLPIALNGEKTISEDFADNMGLRAAYLAYSKLATQDNKIDSTCSLPEKNCPSDKLIEDQQFFLSFAQTHCESQSKDAMKQNILNDIHSPGRFRVIGTLQNSHEFAKAYNCPVGSRMNPFQNQHKKCLSF